MSSASTAEHQKHVRAFKMVLIALLIGTVITVAVGQFHFGDWGNIAVALLIASVKASLVALIFMHLKAERAFLYGTLALCVFFFMTLLILPVITVSEGAGRRTQYVAPFDAGGGEHAEHETDGH